MLACLAMRGVVMNVGFLVKTCYNPTIGIVVERFEGWRFRVVWSNGQSGVHNASSLEVICR